MYFACWLSLISIIHCKYSGIKPGENSLKGKTEDQKVAEKSVELEVDNTTVKVQQNQPFNISLALRELPDLNDVEIFVECNGFMRLTNSSGNRFLFSKQITERSFELESSLYGIYTIRFYQLDPVSGHKIYFESPQVEVFVKREKVEAYKNLTYLFVSLLGVALVLMGLELDMAIVMETIKRPIGPMIGMFCQFLLMPLFSYLLGWLLLSTTYERLGLLILGCCPGGANSNFWTAMFDGDVNLSCTMTFISSVGSFAFTTLWVYFLGAPMVGRSVPIPYLQLTTSLAFFVLPLLLGILIQYKLTKVSDKLKKLSRPFFFVCLIIFPVVGTVQNIHFFYLCGWEHVVAGAGLGMLGYIAGALLAGLLRQGKQQIIAISLETAIQNGGIAFTVLTLTFDSPVSDMSVIPIIAFFLFSTGPIVFIFYGVYFLYKRIQIRREFQPVAVKPMQ